MFCPKCGTQLPDGSLFCAECGASLQTRSAGEAQQAVSRSVSAIASAPSTGENFSGALANTYDLTGLKLVFGALICLMGVGAVISGVSDTFANALTSLFTSRRVSAPSVTAPAVLGGILYIAGFVALFVGLSQSKRHSAHFQSSLKMFVGMLVTGVVAIILGVAVLVGAMASRDYSVIVQASTIIVVVEAIALIVIVVFAMMAYKHIILGMADIPAANGNADLRDKCLKVWSLLRIAFTITIVALVLTEVVAMVIIFAAQSLRAVEISIITGIASALGIIAIIGAIFMLAMFILMFVRMFNVISLYDKRPLPQVSA